MSAVDYVTYQEAVAWMEGETVRRRAVNAAMARRIVAREIGVAPGTVESLRKGRLKSLRGHIERLIDAAFVRMLEHSIEGLAHEMALARARGADRGLVAKAEASRRSLEQLIAQAGRRGAP